MKTPQTILLRRLRNPMDSLLPSARTTTRAVILAGACPTATEVTMDGGVNLGVMNPIVTMRIPRFFLTVEHMLLQCSCRPY